MKRILLLVCLLLISVGSVQAQAVLDNAISPSSEKIAQLQPETVAKDKAKVKESLPFKIGNPAIRLVQNLTGITPISQFLLNRTLEIALRHQFPGKVKAKVRLWSLTDLLAGKIKGAKLSLNECSYQGIPLGVIEAEMNAPLQLAYSSSVPKKRRKLALSTPILVSLKVKVREKDLAAALESTKVTSSLRALKLDLPGLGQQQLEVLSPKVSLDSDLITVNGTLVTKGASADTGVPLTLSGNLKLKGDESIVLENCTIDCKTLVDPAHFASFFEDLLNPIVTLHKFDKPNRALRLDNLTIAKGFVTAEGRVILAP